MDQTSGNAPAIRCGHVAIIGRPNVGKSTLLNRILGQKISITSNRPQTTRHRILGIKTTQDAQVVYVDTPGLHRAAGRPMNRYMNRVAGATIQDVDVIILVVEGLRWADEDQDILERLKTVSVPVVLVVNKLDKVTDKGALLPHFQKLAEIREFAHIIPVSAKSGKNIETLEKEIIALLPIAPLLYPEDQVTDRSERFLAAELIREKLMRRLGQELPHAAAVEIEKFSMQNEVAHINALIWVERPGQKAIVIGKDGAVLKEIGTQARQDMEKIFGCKVFLRLWVKIKEGWSEDERALRSLGYGENL